MTDEEKKERSTWLYLLKPSGGIAQLLTLLLIGGVIYASYAGHLDTLRTVLSNDKYAFTISDYEITAYTVLKGIFIAVLLFWGTAIISGFGEARISRMHGMKRSTQILFTKFFQILVYVVAFLVGLDLMGIELTALAVFGGALGIGLGFGLQKITSNFISGIILLMEKTINQDDLIELQDGYSGFVRRISSRFTLLETFDGKEIMIPNEDFITSQVINWTYSNKKGRVEITVGVAYGSDLEHAQQLIIEAAKEHPRCMLDPEPTCFLNEFGDSSINFLLYFWVSDVTEGRLQPRSEVMMGIWKKFRDAGIEIPFPQRDLHIRSAEGLPQPQEKNAGKKAKA